MPQIGKILIRSSLFSLLIGFSLTSCVHREKAARATPVTLPTETVPGTNMLHPSKSRGVAPVSLEAPLLATTEPYHIPSAAPEPPPTKAEQIAALVSYGSLVESKRGIMIFARTKAAKNTSSSLYEDAILLGKVRRSLAGAKLPGDFPIVATVTDGVACLKLDGERSAEPSAKAIDAALRTSGIVAVEVRLVSSARL